MKYIDDSSSSSWMKEKHNLSLISYAKSAGEAAMRARMAYERTLGQVKQQSETFGTELLEEVKHQARVQSTKAQII